MNIKPYTLISKQLKIDFKTYAGLPLRLIADKGIATVDEVVVSKTNAPQCKKIITTYRNALGQILERVVENTDPYNPSVESRIFRHDSKIIKEGPVNKTAKTRYTLNQLCKDLFIRAKLKGVNQTEIKEDFWTKKETVTDFVLSYLRKKQKHLTRTVTRKAPGISVRRRELHTITQYPVPVKGERHIDRTKIKRVELLVQKRVQAKSEILSIKTTPNIKLSDKDEYLPYRAYEEKNARIPLTNHFLQKNDLHELKIRINPESILVQNNDAMFEKEFGEIHYADIMHRSKADLVLAAAHETDHAHKQSLIGRAKNGTNSAYGKRCFSEKGGLQTCKELEESIIYRQADKEYPDKRKYANINDFYKALDENPLEISAVKESAIAREDYLEQGIELQKIFEFVPREWL